MGRRVIYSAIISTAAVLLACCSSPLRESIVSLVREYSTPTALVYYSGEISDTNLFEDNSGIAADSLIKIIFSETMNIASLAIGGNAASECTGQWSTTDSDDDTLKLSPDSTWTRGSGRTLTIDCSDLEAYPTAQIALSFGVLDGVIYVHADRGSDILPGTAEEPKATIAEAVKLADYLYQTAEVHVAAGTYRQSSILQMADGISLYGGYSADDWNSREDDPLWAVSGDKQSAFPTIITGVNVTFTLHFSNLTSIVTIDGFEIDAGTGDTTTGLYCENSSPIISGLKIGGGLGAQSMAVTLTDSSDAVLRNSSLTGGTNGWSGGMLINESSPEILGCLINGGTSGTDGYTFGIYNIGSAPLIHENEINGGNAWGQSTGISNTGGSSAIIFNNTIDGGLSQTASTTGISNNSSSPLIRNNTICGGNSTGPDASDSSEGLFNVNSSTPVIENNIIFTTAGNNRIGVSSDSASAPASLNNNNIFDCPKALYSVTAASTTDYTNIGSMESALGSSASGNTSISSVFVNQSSDWHLASASDVNVRQGGLDGAAAGWGFTTDMDGTGRTNSTSGSPTNIGAAGWSMGAFEKD